MATKKTLVPTRKWFATAITLIGGWLVTWGAADFHVSNDLWRAGIGVLVALAFAYFVPNQDTPGGVPTKTGPKL